jgi:hypothetical protein
VDLSEEALGQLEAELEMVMAMSVRLGVPAEIKETSASTPMMTWQECRGPTIRHRSQNRMSTMITEIKITDELKATAIRK